ncbi:MAG: ABC transporter permease [Candidatus Eiseniibacteriota bacterium]|nr:MAG: ABC transporter permease [Candidatus Eisenbacteria bacterium]
MRGSSLWIVSNIAACDFKLTWKERSVIFWIFLMPIAFMLFFGVSFRGSGGSTPRAKLTVENQDGGFLSSELLEALRKESISLVDSLAEGENPVRTLVIPPEFTKKVLSRERTTLVIRREEGVSQEASEAVSVAVLRSLIRIVSGLIELEGEALEQGDRRFTTTGSTLSGSLWELGGGNGAFMDSIHVELDSLQTREPLVTVSSTMAGRAQELPSGFRGSVPGSLVMFVLMSMVFGGIGITQERVSGILKRLGMTPASRIDVLLGKLLGRMGVAFIQIAVLLLAGRFLFGVSLGSSPFALVALMVVFTFCTGGFSILFGSLFRTPEHMEGIAVITTLVMAALGGCWWPIEMVGKPFQILALVFPTGWAMNGLHKLISFGLGTAAILPHLAVLAAFGLVFLLVGARKLKWTA